MLKSKIYLDTSVPSAYFDERTPERQQLTQEFWSKQLPEFEALISEFVIQEIDDVSDSGRRAEMRRLVKPLGIVDYTEDAQNLIQQYIEHDVFTQKSLLDATHVAIAVMHRIGYLVSWNFRHLVKVRIRRGVNLVNSQNGYEPIEIIAPPEI